MQNENAKSQMKKGLLEYAILLIINHGEIYASDIIDKLKSADLLVVEGTLYPLLTRLKNNGYLSYRWVESVQGPPRKYFLITETGKAMLSDLEDAWKSLNTSINKIKK